MDDNQNMSVHTMVYDVYTEPQVIEYGRDNTCNQYFIVVKNQKGDIINGLATSNKLLFDDKMKLVSKQRMIDFMIQHKFPLIHIVSASVDYPVF